MEKIKNYLNLIAQHYPELVIEQSRLHTTEGQFNDIVLINESLLFRFPRSAEVAGGYAPQAALLDFLAKRLPLPIPEILYTHLEAVDWREKFLGYRLIQGKPLFRQELQAIEDELALRQMAGQLAGFLRALHQIPPASLPAALPVQDEAGFWEDFFRGVRRDLFPHMRPDARREVDAYFERYDSQPELNRFQPALRHGDFGGSNILYDPQTLRISGIIDFESLGVGDPAADAAGLMTYGEAFFEMCVEAYPELGDMRARALFHRGTFALQEAWYGFQMGDEEAFQSGMADYL
ncbi:MAG TPA: phosphotransferase [Anaerolineaceae bacterium]|nr:phosphotransferase [Anaerolineaceae bacterium]HPN53210.1 phosphotransferase [Anaerolineaceae bacterium]